MDDVKSNVTRGMVAQTLIWIVMVVELVSLVSDYFQYVLLQDAANGVGISRDMADANDGRQRIIGIVYLVVYIVSGITFILWFRRAYYNLHTQVALLQHGEGWAAGGWFVPIVSWWRPYQIMREMYVETQHLFTQRVSNYTQRITTALLGWWWTLWIVEGALAQISFRLSKDAKTVDDFVTSTTWSMISSVVALPLALITIKIIYDYAKVEHLMFALEPVVEDIATDEVAEGATEAGTKDESGKEELPFLSLVSEEVLAGLSEVKKRKINTFIKTMQDTDLIALYGNEQEVKLIDADRWARIQEQGIADRFRVIYRK